MLTSLILLAATSWSNAEVKKHAYCGPPPPAPATSKAAGEGAPPLPIDPGITQRRTENKRRPTPPILFAKIGYGKQLETETKNTAGDMVKLKYWDWNTDEADVQTLLKLACPELKVRYHWQLVYIDRFDFSPRNLPCLYLTGHVDFDFTDEQIEKLRRYVEEGGFIFGEACCGDTEWAAAFERLSKRILPDRPFRPIPADHPIYSAHFPVTEVEYTSNVTERISDLPVLYGMNYGCRTAIIMSSYDLKRGWQGNKAHPWTRGIADEHARKIGTNIVAYILATIELGEQISKLKVIQAKDGNKVGRFPFAQLRHSGDWDPNPVSASYFLKEVKKGSFVNVNFDRSSVELTDKELPRYPFLYMTGHFDFEWTRKEQIALRKHLESGATILIDNCCGRAQFDVAVRRELSNALSKSKLKPLPAKHSVFHMMHDIEEVEYNENVQYLRPELTKPEVEGVDIAGRTAVFYFKYDLGNGWEKTDDPFASSVSPRDSVKLGLNVILYSLTH